MELMALDINRKLVSYLQPFFIEWHRKYYEAGDFTIEIPASQYDKSMKYIYTNERSEVGIINKVLIEDEKITLKGFFLEKMLDDKIIFPAYQGSGEIGNSLERLIAFNKKDIKIDKINKLVVGEQIDFQETGEQLGKKLYEILSTQEMSYKMSYDYVNDKVSLDIYRGTDKTESVDQLNFSTNYGNMQNILINVDDSNYKNYAIVQGEGLAKERITIEVDASAGKYRKYLYVDARDMQQEEGQSLQQYQLSLAQRGKEKLAEHQITNDIDFDIIGNKEDYMKEYDLGTRCNAIINDLNLSFKVRIIEVIEVFKDGMHSIELVIGNKKGARKNVND